MPDCNSGRVMSTRRKLGLGIKCTAAMRPLKMRPLKKYLLQTLGDIEQISVLMPASDELKSNWQTVRGQTARHRQGRMTGEIEGVRVRVPSTADRPCIAPGDFDPPERIK